MSNAGSTRSHSKSHQGRGYRRSPSTPALPDTTISVSESQGTPTTGLSRRHRGYQPDEVNKPAQKLELEDSSTTQGDGKAISPTVDQAHPEASATNSKLASTMTPRSAKSQAPHRQTQMKETKSKYPPIVHTQVATMDASRPALDLVHFDGASEPIDSEPSSMQIITERRPSCWSVASPPETPPTEWNSAVANIDRPATTTLPIYRVPKPQHKTEHKAEHTPDIASSSFSRQLAKIKVQATGSTPKAQRPDEVNRSPRLSSPGKDQVASATRAASQKEDHAAHSLHDQFQHLKHDVQHDAGQASRLESDQDEVLSKTMQASPELQLESDEQKIPPPTQGTPQGKLIDVEGNSIAPSAIPSHAKTNQLSTPSGKRNGVALPHLRVQSTRPESNTNIQPIPTHLETRASPSTPTTAKTMAQNEGRQGGTPITSAVRASKLPPHLRSLSKSRATNPLPVTTPVLTSPKKDDSHSPTINIDEEIAATQPILDIDEEIVAGLRADTNGATAVAQPTNKIPQDTNEQVVYIPSPTRASISKSKDSATELVSRPTGRVSKSQADQHGVRSHSTNTKSNGFTFGPRAKLASPLKQDAFADNAESSVKEGKRPAREFGSVDCASDLIGWDGKMTQPPVGDEWDRRRPFNPQNRERLSVIEAWREEHAADPEENNRIVVNTASADFQTGEGLAAGDVHVLSPIDKMDHETRASNDDFTQARRHQNAADAMKEYEAKIAAKPKATPSGIEGMTREEKRNLRRALIEVERTRRTLPNPHAPAANIYLRPAEFKDMGQVSKIDNYYVRETNFVLHLQPVEELYWRNRLQEAENERNPFVVAIHMGEKSCRHQGDIIRRKQENVVGFAVAADLGNKDTMYHSSVELELMVHPDFYQQGIGRTLLDRILGALSPDHNLLECAPFLPHNDICHWIGGGSRQAKAIIVNIHYSDGEEEVLPWRKQWLAKYEFQQAGTLPCVGFKKHKLVNTCQLVLTTSARL